jgi:pyruvate formate-lyase activating enzyme-like uncharacterized protein
MLSLENLVRRERLVAANAAEYGEQSRTLNWVTPEIALAAEIERTRMLADMAPAVTSACRQTKPHLGALSPGCRICTRGSWSCLFINSRCNCSCFYCPTSQNDISVPTTNRIPFARAGEYAAYVDQLKFQGASISGGEPLMTFTRTVRYIEAVRRRMGDDLHIWLYTNGTLLTAEHVAALQAAGLNEIRFDLSAVNYDLKKLSLAAGRIPCVTVEIPAIPEDSDKLGTLLPALQDAGVDYLNLHQLRLTPYNRARLQTRNYTYLHGEKVTVLESELAALALMRSACDRGIGLPINYCSFAYKHRYQNAAVRRRYAPYLVKGYEDITPSGYIRTLVLFGSAERLSRQAGLFAAAGGKALTWLLTTKKDRLYFHPALWPAINFEGLELQVGYAEARLSAHASGRNAFREIRLTPKTKLYVEKQPLIAPVAIDAAHDALLGNYLADPEDGEPGPGQQLPESVSAHEFIYPGLQDYY